MCLLSAGNIREACEAKNSELGRVVGKDKEDNGIKDLTFILSEQRTIVGFGGSVWRFMT